LNAFFKHMIAGTIMIVFIAFVIWACEAVYQTLLKIRKKRRIQCLLRELTTRQELQEK
jgi:hypothetical protein